MILALALSPSLDVTYEVGAIALGGITRPRAVTRVAGGKALNVARAARQLGADVHAVVALGGPSGRWIADLLQKDGIASTVVPLAAVTRTCLAIVQDDAATSSTDVYEPATPLDDAERDAFADAAVDVAAAAARGSWAALSGSVPPGVSPSDLGMLLVRLRETGRRIAVDSSGDGLRAAVPHADLLKVNRAEAEELLGLPHPDAASAARALRERWNADCVVTDGVRQGFAILGGAEVPIDAPAAPGRFPAGSGDAFLGGLLTGLESGLSPAGSIALARSAGERNARCPGQGILAAR